ncbi:MAG: DUF192 domain-containing protein [Candidatus Omnitrophica bacterium]|nr:DUF192 domain-containing protein [Candidatus Omnitrophota bacterium]
MTRAWLLAVCLLSMPAQAEELMTIRLPNGRAIHAELADTPEARERGLMFRDGLPPDGGMFFAFDDDIEHVFTMKNTRLDLDVLFLDAQGRIRQIVESVPHPEAGAEDGVEVRGRGAYVLELPAGISRTHRLRVGDTLDFTPPPHEPVAETRRPW